MPASGLLQAAAATQVLSPIAGRIKLSYLLAILPEHARMAVYLASGFRSSMTLVLSCITQDFVIQVSDRRLTYLDGRPPDDETNKAVFILGRMLMSFAGVGYIARTATHIWVVERLAELTTDPNRSMNIAFKQFADEASDAFQRIRGREAKRHAFVAVGWGQSHARPDQLYPFIWTISNTLDQNANWLPLAERRFTIQQRLLAPGEPYFLLATGQPLTPSEDASIRRNIRRCLHRNAGPGAAGRLLAALVRVVAERNATVGKNLLVSVLSRGAVGKMSFTMSIPGVTDLAVASLSNLDEPVFAYMPADSASLITYGPSMVLPGGIAAHTPTISAGPLPALPKNRP